MADQVGEDQHWECDCVPELGPSHCHRCSAKEGYVVPWGECSRVNYVYTVGFVSPSEAVVAHDEWIFTEDQSLAREWVAEALASGTFSNAILVRRPENIWEPVEGKADA